MTPEEAVRVTVKRALSISRSGGKTALRKMLKEANDDLGERLIKLSKRGLDRPLEVAQIRQYREQIAVVQKILRMKLGDHLTAEQERLIEAGVQDSLGILRAFDAEYGEISGMPLRIDSAMVMSETKNRVLQTQLRRNEASLDRYGEAMVGELERVMRTSLVAGRTISETISKMVRANPDIAHALRASNPRSFPDPDAGFLQSRYWAERIVRTENANAYNHANLASIQEVAVTNPGMGKKIIATFDGRTAMDSMYVHGQIRGPEEMFVDGQGRQYLRPPSRPNDRETVIPWREGWEENEETRAKSLEDIKKLVPPGVAKKVPNRPSVVIGKLDPPTTKKRKPARVKKPEVPKPAPKPDEPKPDAPKPTKKTKKKLTPEDVARARKKTEEARKKLAEQQARNERLKREAEELRRKAAEIKKPKGPELGPVRERAKGVSQELLAKDYQDHFQSLREAGVGRDEAVARGWARTMRDRGLQRQPAAFLRDIDAELEADPGSEEKGYWRIQTHPMRNLRVAARDLLSSLRAKDGETYEQLMARANTPQRDRLKALAMLDVHKSRIQASRFQLGEKQVDVSDVKGVSASERQRKAGAHSIERFVSSMVDDRVRNEKLLSRVKIKNFKKGGVASERAWANYAVEMLNAGASWKPSTMVHEWGHMLEQSSGTGTASRAFVRRRGGGQLKKLSEITGNQGFDDDEVAYEDKWISQYVGKSYTSGKGGDPYRLNSTEVHSMGVEQMHVDPLKFAANDMEHFELTLGTLTHEAQSAMMRAKTVMSTGSRLREVGVFMGDERIIQMDFSDDATLELSEHFGPTGLLEREVKGLPGVGLLAGVEISEWGDRPPVKKVGEFVDGSRKPISATVARKSTKKAPKRR